uniref:LisH domain-containing protein n=1 Tax=Knipowitschia caucasica TaxID=637954 RepID=A0AAV2MIQ1_KNICA
MAASNPELIPLIYRHLKEHGFHTAAEALQKQSIQNETPPPASLLDIYSSWLKTCKRKKKLSSSTPGKKPAKPIKAAAERKNKDKAAKQRGSPNKKSPTKEKKVDGKASEKKIKSNKKQAKKKKSGEDSDSDSSLDVEKWKKLVEQMTDADLAKVEEFNALAAPKPKRVRKSRAKPKPKSEDQPSKTPEKYTEDIVAQKTLENVAEDSNPITEEMAPKKKKKKKDKSRVELDTLPPEDVIAETTQRTEKKKKKKKQCHVSEVPEEPSDPPSTPQTPGPKKKKHKLQPEELTEADPSSPTAENETPKKKKKKSTKGQGTES